MKNLSKALISFHEEIGKITKDATNPFFNSSYASLSNILEAIKEPLKKAGLAFTQIPTGDNELRTILMHAESGEFVEGTYKMILAKQDPQGQGSAITYARRYALSAILGLNIEDDDDGNYASGNTKQTATKFIPKPRAVIPTVIAPKPKITPQAPVKPQPKPPVQEATYDCAGCPNTKITKAEADYSVKHFGISLCRKCQAKNKKITE